MARQHKNSLDASTKGKASYEGGEPLSPEARAAIVPLMGWSAQREANRQWYDNHQAECKEMDDNINSHFDATAADIRRLLAEADEIPMPDVVAEEGERDPRWRPSLLGEYDSRAKERDAARLRAFQAAAKRAEAETSRYKAKKEEIAAHHWIKPEHTALGRVTRECRAALKLAYTEYTSLREARKALEGR